MIVGMYKMQLSPIPQLFPIKNWLKINGVFLPILASVEILFSAWYKGFNKKKRQYIKILNGSSEIKIKPFSLRAIDLYC